MSQQAIDVLRAELGAAAKQLPPALSGVHAPAVAALAAAVKEAKTRQKRLLEESAEHSLRLVPALLRPVVRKALFG